MTTLNRIYNDYLNALMLIPSHHINELRPQHLFQSASDHYREDDKTKTINSVSISKMSSGVNFMVRFVGINSSAFVKSRVPK